jgi:LysR family glycine cleavage system transcriptional activator
MRVVRSPPLRLLRVFCVAARRLSFKEAAEELHLTPSAVSHQVLDLEDHLEVRLFVRRTRALELTDAGRRLLEEVEPLLARLDEAIGRVAKQGRRSTVRLALPPFFASELFIPQLTSLLDLRPDLDLRIATSDPRPAAHAAADDVSILLAAEEPASVRSHRLFRLSLIPVASPELAQRVDELGTAAFSELPLIMHRAFPLVWRDWALAVGLPPPEPRQAVELDSTFAVARAAERGVGLALVPAGLTRSWLDDGALVRVSAAALDTGEYFFLVYRPEDSKRAEVRAVVDWTLREFADADA